ncbi:MAG: heparan-alpha-glucosaminide N-acetyltransferase [Oscillospiraceae bacterium]|nr:heparan-alpha-glucosaminide N-acetyltransferase [Oscillospiraceae bacterium]
MTQSTVVKAARRYPFLDELRGAAIMMMIAYHFLYDGVVFAGWEIPLFSPPLSVWQDSIGALFILLSGCVSLLTRSNLKRGLRCLGAACLITAVTFFLIPTVADWFGVLHFLGCAMLLYPLVRPLLERVSPLPGAVFCGVLFWITYPVNQGALGWPLSWIKLPSFFYQNFATAILGFPPYNFVSSDYYPLLPWIFLFFCGNLLGRVLVRQGDRPALLRSRSRPLALLGQHSFAIYLVHQPVLYGLFLLARRIRPL